MTDTTAPDETLIATAIAEIERRCAADEELVHGDVVEEVAAGLPVTEAVELCERTMAFVPDTVRRRLVHVEFGDVIAADREARAASLAEAERAQARTRKAAATRAATIARENAEQAAAIVSARCDKCFQVRTPSGVCGCD